ncbi:tail length tape measure protein [Pseudomonas phage Littlefix]|uniref:Tape measure protein n=1 Tax=Pseudomonas phage Littlefix TaxID=2079289 RepID=A0A2K9VHK3_9CAUD|nr:tail length tape measure protein [Pseudomonas phage Littlefix]AUV61833.1 hypothetical protein PsPhLittlefix_gp18 [Pseudomonas phage Littlefix]
MDKNILAMSDEDLLALGPQSFDEAPAEKPVEQPPQEQPEVVQDDDQHVEEEQEQGNKPADQQPADNVDDPDDVDDDQSQPVKPVEATADVKPEPTADQGKETTGKVPEVEQAPVVSAEDQLAKLFAPIKASGRTLQISSVEEAIQLAQKGLNYHDKMAGLKPSLNIVRTLEREGLLDPNKINELIDLYKKKPEAIAKLVKDSGVDLLDIDDKQVAAYKPDQYGLSETETALEDVMSELKQTPAYDRVINFAGNQIDNASKQLIIKNPHVLMHFAEQVESGVFDVIQAELAKQKVLGNLKGLNDIQAYDAVGKHLAEKGAFNHLQKTPAVEKPPVVVQPKAPKPVDPAVAAAKAAAAPAKTTPTGKSAKPSFNPLALSDEEFEKLAKETY